MKPGLSFMSPSGPLSALQLGRVDLRVGDLRHSLKFYRDLLGLEELDRGPERVDLGHRDGEVILRLWEIPGLRPFRPQAPGLYHVALLLPDAGALARVLVRLYEHSWPLQGLSDHGVSQAIYLPDPDGIGLEIYVDRPREAWASTPAGGIRMTTLPLDVETLMQTAGGDPTGAGLPPGTRIGHVHLHAADVPNATAFYREVLGLEVTFELPGSAVFLAAGGYHHHLALNSWARARVQVEAPLSAGLVQYELVMEESDMDAVLSRAREAGAETEHTHTGWQLRDAEGLAIGLRILQPAAADGRSQ